MRACIACVLIAAAVIACNKDDGGGPDGPGTGVDGGTPDAAGPPSCVFHPTGVFNPAIECAWNQPAPGSKYPALDDVVMTPVVINLTDDDGNGQVTTDDVPDIAFVSYGLQTGAACPAGLTCGCCNSSGVLRVVSGRCDGSGILPEHFSIGADEIEADIGVAGLWLDNSGGLAAGDIDSDGAVDLVATVQNGGTIAFERDGRVKWYQPAYPAAGTEHLAGTEPAIADLDADGRPEVIQGRVVLNGADGTLAWAGTAGVGTNGFMGPVTVAGDVDLDGKLELLAGGTLYRHDGTPAWSFPFTRPIDATNCQSSGFPCDGFTATGNFDGDNQGEIVDTRAGYVYLFDHDGTAMEYAGAPVEIQLPVDDCAKNEGGPPTVADFDGDGQPEIGVAGADFYIVVDLECLDLPLSAECASAGIRWQVANADCSSRVTGSSVFDFEGDGRAEVIYADETAFRVFDGIDGTVRLSLPNHSHTRLEMPIVADADNDGNAEVVYIENANGGGTTQGIRVLGDATDSWVSTRRVWNQHSYHVTNVSELGAIPAGEPANWLEPTDATISGVMNNFRQNLPEADAFAAPDLTLDISVDAAACKLDGTVCNAGDQVVGPGVAVHFYDTATMIEIACLGGPVVTTQSLAPGACETVRCVFPDPVPTGAVDVRGCVDNAGYDCTSGGVGANNECLEDNNLDTATGTPSCIPNP
jgi:hypothetical protein